MARAAWSRVLAVAAVAGLLSTMPAAPSYASTGLSCRYTPIQWSGGFSADLTIYNHTASSIDGWTAFWTFPTATRVTTTWNGSITQGTLYDATARNTIYNGVIRPGSSAALGWTATATTTEIPTEIIVNGSRCPVS